PFLPRRPHAAASRRRDPALLLRRRRPPDVPGQHLQPCRPDPARIRLPPLPGAPGAAPLLALALPPPPLRAPLHPPRPSPPPQRPPRGRGLLCRRGAPQQRRRRR